MKNISIFISLVLILLYSCHASPQMAGTKTKGANLVSDNLRGRVKSIIELGYDAVDSSKLVSESMFRYDTTGRRFYYGSHSIYMPVHWVLTRYDNNGNEIEYTAYKSDSSIDYVKRYSYDDHGYKKGLVTTLGHGDTVAIGIYDHGDLIEEDRYMSGDTIRIYRYKYDANGNEVWCSSYDKKKGETIINTTEYNDKEYKIKEIDNQGNYRHSIVSQYVYDDHGNMILCTYSNYNHSETTKYRYEYDKQGNWIKKYTDNQNKPSVIRQIEYYP